MTSTATVQPFTLKVDQDGLRDLYDRLARTRWPADLAEGPSGHHDSGLETSMVKSLVNRWMSDFSWPDWVRRLNTFPQFVTMIDGSPIHFLHVRSTHSDALPLVLTHGWPSSVLEFVDVIGPLVDPVTHGGSAKDAFHVVIPSLPGFGLSGPPADNGWDVRRIATAWAALMRRLGYERYGAHGGDWGSAISRDLGALDAEHLVGTHVNYLVTPPPKPGDEPELSEEDAERVTRTRRYLAEPPGYWRIQATRPHTLAFSLTDSPVGQLTWILDRFLAWSDPRYPLDLDRVLATATLYWLTGTAGSSAQIYLEAARTSHRLGTMAIPLGVAVFPHDIAQPVRWLAEASYPITSWTEFSRGGHFPAIEVPDLLAEDIRGFFGSLR